MMVAVFRTWHSAVMAAVLTVAASVASAQEYHDYYKAAKEVADQQVSKSSVNYVPIASEICAGCTDDYQRARAIYLWVCDHIAYDTSYKIRTADECYKNRRGVCQGYCELYYQLAKAVGVRVEIVYGKSKDQTGYVNPSGHGWLFAYTAKDRGILLDPTWGAGAVTAEGFVKDEHPMDWFNVEPEWMILSHFPEDKGYQLLERPMTEKTFLTLAPVDSRWLHYGADVHKVYEEVIAGRLSMPQFYDKGGELVRFLDFPMSKTLQIGHSYDFRIRTTSPRDFIILNNSVSVTSAEWTKESDDTYAISFIPRDTESLTICLRDAAGTSWNTVVKYDIAEPTAADWKLVEQHFPEYSPEMKSVKNLNVAEWREAGVDSRQLLNNVRSQHITELPVFYEGKGRLFNVASVPMNRQLSAGQSYTFSIFPKGYGMQWAVVSGGEWFTDWKIDDGGQYTLTVTPGAAGPLGLYVQTDPNDSYWPCLEYVVQ